MDRKAWENSNSNTRDDSYLGLSGFGDFFHFKVLSSVKLNAREADDRDLMTMLLNGLQDILCPQQSLTLTGLLADQGLLGVTLVPTDLRLDSIVVRREGLGFNQDLVAVLRWDIEGSQEGMEVGGEGVHDGDFVLFGTDHASGLLLDGFFNADPGAAEPVLEMRVDGSFTPDLEFFSHVASHGLGEETQGVSAKVGAWLVRAICA